MEKGYSIYSFDKGKVKFKKSKLNRTFVSMIQLKNINIKIIYINTMKFLDQAKIHLKAGMVVRFVNLKKKKFVEFEILGWSRQMVRMS